MFDVITKEEYWQWISEGVTLELDRDAVGWGSHPDSSRAMRQLLRRLSLRVGPLLRPLKPYELKNVQDAFILSRLRNVRRARILEIGGGISRVLPLLSSSNECWLVDRFEGRGGGPVRQPRFPGIRKVLAYMGDFSPELQPGYFDFVVSISVLEHVPLDSLDAFFRDCARILKVGGHMLHAIDFYLFDSTDTTLAQPFVERLQAYLGFADRPDLGIKLVQKPGVDHHLGFSCRYATLPDNELHRWYLNGPGEKRLLGQVVSLKSEWVKTPETSR